ncbi:MAG: PQQ-binding-like beta-propeller repeat protein [Deltaproteobacteria bacterium]|nr:PQQ-binding-like beta-propeller repeat protein [Deltaproteobacteria bacterium]
MPKNFLKKRQAFLSVSLFSALLAIFASGCAPYKTPEGSRPWSAYLYGGERTNVSEDKITLPARVSWTKDVSPFTLYDKYEREQLSSPVIVEGALYVGSANERLYSIRLDSGGVNWRFYADYPMEAAPTAAGGLVCFGAGDGILRCLERATGKEVWSYQAKSEVIASPLVKDGRIYAYSADDKVTALDLKTGEKLWSYVHGTYGAVAPRITAAPAAAPGKNRIFQFFSDGVLVCLDADSGKAVWSKKIAGNFDTAAKIRRTPLLHSGNVYMIDDANIILALDQDTGELRNIFNVIKAFDFVITGKRSIVIAGLDQAVALDLATGAILWKSELKYNPMSSIFAAGDYLFAVSNYRYAPLGISWLSKLRGYIQALDLATGEAVWGKRLGSVITANASASEDRITLLMNDGTLQVFEPKK